MRHLKKGKKFHRLSGQRRSFLRNLANDLVRTGGMETTEIRAKAIRPIVEKLVTMAKKQNLASRRILLARTQNSVVAEKLYGDLAKRYAERRGGYLRIIKLSKSKKRDGSRLAKIEFV
ncbi:MAG: 50S ribosomal protein L17 [Patescibacteria group bacterium]|nr:50S ribosomal protein L17 [Patescibacteria group bacterium]MDE2014941.1 50S ribosomal protein L17 [Patescibacteria group bacterium]MDE2226370.1 50S ribosomal protein L17 [Patescibacteria group bacterium]